MGQAVGIPDTTNYGNIDDLEPGKVYDLCIQRHLADRAGEHFDFRIGNERIGLLSWAIPKAKLPEAGERLLAVQQPLHEYSYKDFEGDIKEGYGKGTVKLDKQGKVLVTDKTDSAIYLTIISDRYPTRLVLIRPKEWNSKDWLLINNTPTKPIDYQKIHMKQLHGLSEIERFLEKHKDQRIFASPKIDGAHVIVVIKNGKLDVYSYRISKVHGANIIHTERIFTIIPRVPLANKYDGTILKGELYGIYKNDRSVVPVNILSGILNSNIYKSYLDMLKRGIVLKIGLFDIYQYGKQYIDPENVSYQDRIKLLEEILDNLDKSRFEIIYPVEGKDEIIKLWHSVSSKQHPLTEEGIVIYPEKGLPLKVKSLKEKDVYIRDIYRGTGKYENAAGGFMYSLTPDGPIVGNVGTGFDDEFRKELWENKEDYIGRRARVKFIEQLPSGALRAPVFLSLHEDYPNPHDKNAFYDPVFSSTIPELFRLRTLIKESKYTNKSWLFSDLTKIAKFEDAIFDGIIDPCNPLTKLLFYSALKLNSPFIGPIPSSFILEKSAGLSKIIKLATRLVSALLVDQYCWNEDEKFIKVASVLYALPFDVDKWYGTVFRTKDLDPWTRTFSVALPLAISATSGSPIVKTSSVAELALKLELNPLIGYRLGHLAFEATTTELPNSIFKNKIESIIQPTTESKFLRKKLLGEI
jgi:hypothetical protein